MSFKSPVKTVGSALTNHWYVMVAIVLLSLLVAAAAIVIRNPTYEATSTLLVDERQSSSQGFDLALQASQVLGQQYIDMIGSRALLTEVCREVPTSVACEPDNLARHVNAAAVKGTRMIAVTVSAPSPADAAALANAIASGLFAAITAAISKTNGISASGSRQASMTPRRYSSSAGAR